MKSLLCLLGLMWKFAAVLVGGGSIEPPHNVKDALVEVSGSIGSD